MQHYILILILSTACLISEVGIVVLLPLWLDSTNRGVDANLLKDDGYNKTTGSYGVLLISSILEMVIYFVLYLFFGKRGRYTIGKYFFMSILLNTINGLFTPFLSTSYRNNPSLQAVLSNFYVPLTVVIRMVCFKCYPTLKKSICVCFVIVGMLVAVIPDLFCPSEPESMKTEFQKSNYLIVHRIFWTLGYILLSVCPATLLNVCIERLLKYGDATLFAKSSKPTPMSISVGDGAKDGVKDGAEVQVDVHVEIRVDSVKKENPNFLPPPDILYLAFIISLGQLVGTCIFFWVDLIPNLGFSDNIFHFTESIRNTVLCTTGHGCKTESLGFAIGFILFSVVSFICGMVLIKRSEGSIFLALILNLVTPSAILFWVLFSSQPFRWSPHFNYRNLFSVASLLLVAPSVIVYHKEATETKDNLKKSAIKILP